MGLIVRQTGPQESSKLAATTALSGTEGENHSPTPAYQIGIDQAICQGVKARSLSLMFQLHRPEVSECEHTKGQSECFLRSSNSQTHERRKFHKYDGPTSMQCLAGIRFSCSQFPRERKVSRLQATCSEYARKLPGARMPNEHQDALSTRSS